MHHRSEQQLTRVAPSTELLFVLTGMRWLQGASTPDQARRNSSIPKLPEEILAQCSEATETLRKAAGPEVDQHGFLSRIHGNRLAAL